MLFFLLINSNQPSLTNSKTTTSAQSNALPFKEISSNASDNIDNSFLLGGLSSKLVPTQKMLENAENAHYSVPKSNGRM